MRASSSSGGERVLEDSIELRASRRRAFWWWPLAIALATGHAAQPGGIWAHGGQVLLRPAPPATFSSPDRTVRVEVGSDVLRFIGASGAPVDLGTPEPRLGVAEVVWAANGRAFAVNLDTGGRPESWTLRVFRIVGEKPIELPVRELLGREARDLPECGERTPPNLAAISWAPGSFQLFAVAEVPNRSTCRNVGALRGYRVSLEPLRIEATLSEQELRVKWADVLGSRFAESNAATSDWPAVRPVELRKRIETGNARLRLLIVDASTGAALYELRCGELEAEEPGEDPYYGMFSCRLLERREGDLLRARADWEDNFTTRGVFAFEQVVGPCKGDPYFGLSRTFQLRGMKLSLTISHFESPPVAELLEGAKPDFRFDFDVSIAPDARPAPPRAANPPGRYCNGIFTLDASGKAVYQKDIR